MARSYSSAEIPRRASRDAWLHFIMSISQGLGNWDPRRARRMDFDEGHWRTTMEVQREQLPIEYRYLIVHDATKVCPNASSAAEPLTRFSQNIRWKVWRSAR